MIFVLFRRTVVSIFFLLVQERTRSTNARDFCYNRRLEHDCGPRSRQTEHRFAASRSQEEKKGVEREKEREREIRRTVAGGRGRRCLRRSGGGHEDGDDESGHRHRAERSPHPSHSSPGVPPAVAGAGRGETGMDGRHGHHATRTGTEHERTRPPSLSLPLPLSALLKKASTTWLRIGSYVILNPLASDAPWMTRGSTVTL